VTLTRRYATAPVPAAERAPAPEPLARLEPANLWITVGQVWVAVWFLFAFGLREEGPTTMLGVHFLLGGATFVLGPRHLPGRIRVSLPFVLFVAWWAASYSWTTSVGNWWVFTKGESMEIIPPFLFAAVLPFERITQAIRAGFYVAVLYTLGVTAASPATTTTHLDATGQVALSGWHGSFIHKNDMVFFLLLGLLAMVLFEPRRWVRQLVGVVCAALIVLSRSGTGILATVLLTIFFVWLELHRRQPAYLRRAYAGVSAFVGTALAIVLVPLVPLFLELGGKDATLSGRSDIWSVCWAALQPVRWTGFGVGGVWMDQSTDPTRTIVDQIGFIVFHAHNGPLEMALRLGLVGVALGLWMTADAVRHSWWLQRARHPAGRWMVLMLILMFITWITENTMTGQWLGLIGLCAVLGRVLRDEVSGGTDGAPDPWPVRPRDL